MPTASVAGNRRQVGMLHAEYIFSDFRFIRIASHLGVYAKLWQL